MNKIKWSGTDYHRNDYYTPRNSREAFGMQAHKEDFVTFGHIVEDELNWGDILVVCFCLVIAVAYMFFGLGA